MKEKFIEFFWGSKDNVKTKIEVSVFIFGLLFFIFSVCFNNNENANIYKICTALSLLPLGIYLTILPILKFLIKNFRELFCLCILIFFIVSNFLFSDNYHGFILKVLSFLSCVIIALCICHLTSKVIDHFKNGKDSRIKKSSSNKYGFDIKYELKTYTHVGSIFNKRNAKKKKQKYKVCNNYTEWKNHVKSILHYEMCNKEDFVHWLYDNKNWEKQFLEVIKTIQIPIYVALLSLLNYFGEVTIETIILSTIIIVIFSLICFLAKCQEVNFYEDIIKIVEKEFGVKVN